ncbi:DUF72 domain-containing protein [Polaromonas sp. P1(28)-8]|nr:DUF72 domain-containing protein [Polaromonas sp. P1(28)-8]
MTILVGTASWTDKTLVDSGLFYPPEAKSAEARLRYYASRFPMVEVDSSYYAIPAPSTAQLWVERAPPGFVFNIKALGVAHVVVDEPQGFSNCVPPVWAITSPKLAVVRLHGRNAETWNVKGATVAPDRFNYDYPERELQQLVPGIFDLELQVIFNNNYQDQGQRNAATLMNMLH